MLYLLFFAWLAGPGTESAARAEIPEALTGFDRWPTLQASPSPLAQLNVDGFAACLARETYYRGARLDLRGLKRREDFGPTDLFLPYLAFYPGKELPIWPRPLSRRAQARWSYAWDAPARALAERMSRAPATPGRVWTPADWFGAALEVCETDVFCAVLTAHNVLRTFGRHAQGWALEAGVAVDYNAPWFAGRRDAWIAEIPGLAARMIALRSGPGGERWGEWYHFFGVLGFVIHEMSARESLLGVREIVRLNDRFNEWLTGAPEGAEKARLDLDAIEVARRFVTEVTDPTAAPGTPAENCDSRATYVAF